jgi:hypothetical protein|tara:strand:+ start:2996 stop:3460 length:465 start_codon:yes stop_codon:yes gene_type:complete
MTINTATPQDWDRLRTQYKAIDLAIDDALMQKYIDLADEELAKSDRAAYQATWAEPLPFKLPTDAKERKAIPIYTGFISYFPRAIAAVAQLSLAGGIQHGQTADTLHWDRAKSGDEKDAMMRHIIDEDWDQVAWRAMANLEKYLEGKQDEQSRG